MNPTRSAVAAVTTRVKLPDDEAEVAAAEPGAVTTTGVVATGGRTLAAPTGLISEVLALPGIGCAIAVVVGVATTAGTVVGAATGEGVLGGDALAAGVLAAGVGALTATVSAAVGSTVMAGLVAASAVAVRVTDVTDVAPAATGI